MRRSLLLCAVGAALLACRPGLETATAGKSGASSGRSFSSGSRSSSSGRTSGGRSYSSGSARPHVSPSGKTYSSRSPSSPVPSGKSYSSGSPSGRAAPSGAPISPGGKRGSGFDRAAAEAQRKAESKIAYQRGTQPRQTWTDPKGMPRPIDPGDRTVKDLRRQFDYERWANRQSRERQVFGSYSSRPVVVYHDSYSSLFWWWLLSQGLDQRAAWAYNHRSDMDPQRYQDLLRHDQQMAARVKELEAQGTARDSSYSPPGLDPDLMYTDDYVEAVFNPQPDLSFFLNGLRFLLTALLVLAALAFLIWLVFFKRWGARP
jgi:hypothetical protein